MSMSKSPVFYDFPIIFYHSPGFSRKSTQPDKLYPELNIYQQKSNNIIFLYYSLSAVLVFSIFYKKSCQSFDWQL